MDSDQHNCSGKSFRLVKMVTLNNPSDIDECSATTHGCEQGCLNTEGSYTCTCGEGYVLNDDKRTCSIDCGGTFTSQNGIFHTPDWPERYPFEDFLCEWVIDAENMPNHVIEIAFDEPFGINGRDPCRTDYVEILSVVDGEEHSLEKHCFLRRPQPILILSNKARVVFQGSALQRPESRVGVSITYTMKEIGKRTPFPLGNFLYLVSSCLSQQLISVKKTMVDVLIIAVTPLLLTPVVAIVVSLLTKTNTIAQVATIICDRHQQ